MTADPADFIRANTAIGSPPLVPEIRLHLATEVTPIWQATEESLARFGTPPPFWAFAWAGGQALARYIIDHPEAVAGRDVLDLASGSGLVAIAAAKAGARSVVAGDIDDNALAAIALNAAANAVPAVLPRRADLAAGAGGADVVLAADVFYQRDLAALALRCLRAAQRGGADVLTADPGRAFVPRASLTVLATYQVPVLTVLEDTPVKEVTVYRLR